MQHRWVTMMSELAEARVSDNLRRGGPHCVASGKGPRPIPPSVHVWTVRRGAGGWTAVTYPRAISCPVH